MLPIIQTVIIDFPVVTISIVWIIAIALFVWTNNKLLKIFKAEIFEKYLKSYTAVTMLTLVLLSFLWVGEPFWRLSYFSVSNQALNQLSLNGVYTLIKAYDQKKILENDLGEVTFQFGNLDEALKSTQSCIGNNNEEFVSELYPLARKIIHPISLSTQKPNIVLILMEGFTASNIGILSPGGKGFSPGFDNLSQDGILFRNIYGQGARTHHGIVSTVGSFPSLLGMMLTRRRGTDSFYTLGTLLKQYGYSTSFIYGFESGFDHMGFFLKQGGIDKIIDNVEFPNPKFQGKWGVSDEDLFDKAHEFYQSQTSETPFFSVVLTSSNHSPYEIPDDFLKQNPQDTDKKDQAAFAYSDFTLSQFIENAKTSEYFANTIFVIIADHGEARDKDDLYFKRFHVPCLIYAPHLIKTPRVVETVGSQVDIAPTLMHLIGYPGLFQFFGRDLLAGEENDGFALMRNNFNIYYRKDNAVMVRDLRDTISTLYTVDRFSRIQMDSPITNDSLNLIMNKELESYLQAAHYIYTKGKHRYDQND